MGVTAAKAREILRAWLIGDGEDVPLCLSEFHLTLAHSRQCRVVKLDIDGVLFGQE